MIELPMEKVKTAGRNVNEIIGQSKHAFNAPLRRSNEPVSLRLRVSDEEKRPVRNLGEGGGRSRRNWTDNSLENAD